MKVTFSEVSSNKKDNINSFQTPFGFTPNKKNNKKVSFYHNDSSLNKNQSKPIIMNTKNISSPIKKSHTFNEKTNKLNSKKKKNETKGDRFIPLRENTENHLLLLKKDINDLQITDLNNENSCFSSNFIMNNALFDSILPRKKISEKNCPVKRKSSLPINNNHRLLNFSKQILEDETKDSNQFHRKSSQNLISDVREIYQNNADKYNDIIEAEFFGNENHHHIPNEPERILDAPQLIDDYYLNLLDWGNQNILSVCLGPSVYLWNANNGQTHLLTTSNNNENICSVSFMNNGSCLGIGHNNGITELWDIEKNSKIRNLNGHSNRVSCLNWNCYLLSTGSKDSLILNHDVRIKEHIIHKLINGHNKEVCSLKWDNEFNILASGGNDNIICLWDIKKSQNQKNSIWNLFESKNSFQYNNNSNSIISPLYTFTNHIAAVKALAWSPWQRGILASGGGKKDHSIKFFNAENGQLNYSIDTGSQVCQLIWNKYEKELISSHGYSKNQIAVWSYPKMNKIAELHGHMNRVLYLSMSPDGCTIVSGSSDETLRFWNINDREKVFEGNRKNIQGFDFGDFMNIR